MIVGIQRGSRDRNARRNSRRISLLKFRERGSLRSAPYPRRRSISRKSRGISKVLITLPLVALTKLCFELFLIFIPENSHQKPLKPPGPESSPFLISFAFSRSAFHCLWAASNHSKIVLKNVPRLVCRKAESISWQSQQQEPSSAI